MAKTNSNATESAASEALPLLKLDAPECMEVLAKWNMCMLDFYAKRLQAYWRVPGELPALLTADDCLAAHQRFLERMVADYTAQAEKLRNLVPGDLAKRFEPDETGYEASLLTAQRDAAELIDQAKAQAERIIADARARSGETEPSAHQALKKSA